VARFRSNYLHEKVADGQLAILALEATPDNMVSDALARELLGHVGAYGIVLHKPNATLMLDAGGAPRIDATFDLGDAGVFRLIADAMAALAQRDNHILRVLDISPRDPHTVVEVILDDDPMRKAMWDYGSRIFELSIVISLITAALLYLALQWLLVSPLRRLTAGMVAFRADPEDQSRDVAPSGRADEIGLAQRELAMMQETVRQALRHNARLAALGTAVTKINHDLRAILATARLVSDGLADSAAPEVRRVAPRLFEAIDRAVALCTRTLDFSREGAPPFAPSRFELLPLIEEIGPAVSPAVSDANGLTVEPAVAPELRVRADRDQLFRVLLNLAQNAVEAGARRVRFAASVAGDVIALEVADDGHGLPPRARENLFRPFFGSARPGGTGLGLAIARDLMHGQGGDLVLVETTGAGTIFRLTLPIAEAHHASARRATA